jgi:UDP-N-acetylglucosamine--N-acetylmuramyl-(pentapeptide) pyrophosphoryl-undecaprenol N-acetylglucosamine transferase
VVFNLRDSLLVLLGFLWSSVLLLLHRPHVVFINGGAVGVPVALACRLTRVPYVVHESDVKPGLANRLIIKRAKRVLYGLALAESADQSKSFVVGIPSRPIFAHLARTPVATLKQRHGIDPKRPVVVVTGGSQGAQRLNSLLLAIAGDLSRRADVIHQAGLADQNRVRAAAPAHHYRVEGFMAGDALPEALAMADVVVARSGATTIADLAILSKPAIFIPNPHLARHQGVNADRLQAASAAVVLAEADLVAEPHRLLSAVVALLEDGRRRVALGRSLHRLAAKPHAIVDIARHILEVAEGV